MKKIVILCILPLIIAIAQQKEVKWEKAAENLSFPEGPAWDGSTKLYVSNCYSNWILKIENEEADTFVSAPTQPVNFEKTNGLTVYSDGSIFACDYGRGMILKFTPEGKCEIVAEGYMGKKFNRPNDLAFDSEGNLFFTDPKSYDPAVPDGAVYLITSDKKEVKQIYDGLAFPNGIAFTPDGKYLLVCESANHRILKFRVGKDKSLGKPTVFAELPGGDPDGIAFDKKGNLYVAHFGGQAVYVFNRKGKIMNKLITPGKKPSNVEFGGPDMKTLYITEDETNAVYSTRVDVPGVRLFSSPASN